MEIILIILILTNIFACIGWYRADDKYNDEWEKRNFTDQGLTPPLKENPTKGNQKTRKQILKAKERRKNGKLGGAINRKKISIQKYTNFFFFHIFIIKGEKKPDTTY